MYVCVCVCVCVYNMCVCSGGGGGETQHIPPLPEDIGRMWLGRMWLGRMWLHIPLSMWLGARAYVCLSCACLQAQERETVSE